jgi:orotate phosphoribosyltransferase
MTPGDVRILFEETGALLTGHFELSSGLHSERYLQCARVLQWPRRAEAVGAALAARLVPFSPAAVVSPAMGGLIIGHEVGRGLSVRALFLERVEKVFALRRGFALQPGERVAVIEDVVTTGKSTREVLDVVRALGAEPVACASIVDRRPFKEREGDEIGGLPYRSLLAFEAPAFEPESCPICAAGVPVVAPGSRHLGARP